MQVRKMGNTAPYNPSGGLCDEYRLDGASSWDDVVAFCKRIPENHPSCLPLMTLDFVGQATYTSMHCTHKWNLNDQGDFDLSVLPATCFEDSEYLGYFNSKEEFPMRQAAFRAHVAKANFASACSFGMTIDRDDHESWLAYQESPMSIFDHPISVMPVAVQQACDTLMALPNGYFVSDFGPAENYAIAQHLKNRFGFSLIGVGSSYLGFTSDLAVSSDDASSLANDLCLLYNVPSENLDWYRQSFATALFDQKHLFIRYTESD
jgi:hypothetical protein